MRLATATDVATVEENTVRNTLMPRRYLSAITASTIPSTSPIGTLMIANFTVTQRACWNSSERKRSRYWPNPFDTQLLPKLSQRCWPSHTALPRG